jgi:hypothetical protein
VLEREHASAFFPQRLGGLREQDFDDYIPSQPRIPRAIYLIYAARTEGCTDLIRAKFCTRNERHFSPDYNLEKRLQGSGSITFKRADRKLTSATALESTLLPHCRPSTQNRLGGTSTRGA